MKVKEPQQSEWARLRENHILFTYLHLAPDEQQTTALLNSACMAIAYETVTGRDGGLPLLAPMSEVAGRVSIDAAAQCLRKTSGGMGKLIGGIPGVLPAKVVIIGGGVVGYHAAKMAVGLGASVTILDSSLTRLRYLDEIFGGRLRTRFAMRDAVDEEIRDSDVVVGAVLVPGAVAPKLINRNQLVNLKPASVLIDVAIDQGGCFGTSVPTTHTAPTYVIDGVMHYCAANMPGAVPITSSHALNNATLPYGLHLAEKGRGAVEEDVHLRAGLNVYKGKITNEAVARSLNLEYADPRTLLAA